MSWFNFILGLNLFTIVLNFLSYITIPPKGKYNLNQAKNRTTTYYKSRQMRWDVPKLRLHQSRLVIANALQQRAQTQKNFFFFLSQTMKFVKE